MAFEWELTKETIYLPLCGLQGGFEEIRLKQAELGAGGLDLCQISVALSFSRSRSFPLPASINHSFSRCGSASLGAADYSQVDMLGCWVSGLLLSSLLLSSLELSDTQVCEPQIRALLGTVSNFCKEVVLKLRMRVSGPVPEAFGDVGGPAARCDLACPLPQRLAHLKNPRFGR